MSFKHLYELIKGTDLEPWLKTMPQQIERAMHDDVNGKFPLWKDTLKQLPVIKSVQTDLESASVTVTAAQALTVDDISELERKLKNLIPWRKGPYLLHGVEINTEWKSDLKWDRLKAAIKPLHGKTVLDVGCGNGYHGWRMLGAGAELVIGIDPSALFVMQFQAVKHFLGEKNIFVIPLGIEDVPENLQAFDTVFSMGVFYHRKSPIDHLYQLRQCLKPGGELVLETLVIPGDENQLLMPDDRYAQMRNVWFLPSSQAMKKWLKRCGFKNIKLVNETYTTVDEQRSTDWMQFHSLTDFLDPDDKTKTLEGYPAPLRAIFTADAP